MILVVTSTTRPLFRWCPSIACMAANAASTRISPMAESSAAFRSDCPPGGRARFRLDREERLVRYEERAAKSNDTIASRAFAAGNSLRRTGQNVEVDLDRAGIVVP